MAATSYEVRLTLGAESDLQAIYDHVFEYRSPAQADDLLGDVLEVIDTLERFPDRARRPGNSPPWASGTTVRFFCHPTGSSIG